MRHFILSSHGTFSQGIYNSVKIIMGEQDNVHIITAYVEEGQDIKDLVTQTLQKIPKEDEIIVCTDVFGGSVNNEWMKYITHENLHLVTGMNLPLLMNLFMQDEEDVAAIIRQGIQEAKEGMIYCNDLVAASQEEEEF